MILRFLLVGVLLAASTSALAAEADEPLQVVVLGLETTDIDKGKVALVDGVIADALSRAPNLKVLTRADIERLAAFETDKAMVGCEASSCLAEIAGALGAAYVVFGRMGKLDDLILVQVNLFDAAKAEPVGREEIRATTLRELDSKIKPAIRRLISPLTGEIVQPEADEGGSLLVPIAFGAAGTLAVVGFVLGAVGLAQVPVVEEDARPAKERNDAKGLGAALVVTSAVCLGLAAAAAVAGGAGMVLE